MNSFKMGFSRPVEVDIHVGEGLLAQCGDLLSPQLSNQVAILTHKDVDALYGPVVKESLEKAGLRTVFINIPSGETHKQWDTIANIIPILRAEGFDRGCGIGSLGGGVVGDLAGFLASIYMRGLPLFHLPTTLLAQVDSCLGGKTAINYSTGKNMLGTFYQPRSIIVDTQTLVTLPPQELGAGWAEVVKTALLAGPEFFALLEARVPLVDVVSRCLQFKATVVMDDEGDNNVRQQLNLGHTFGHAFEAAGNYLGLNHGEAVGLGVLCALRLSALKLGLCAEVEERTKRLLNNYDLPTRCQFTYEDVAPHFKADKKAQGGQTRFIGLYDIGKYAVLDGVAEGDIRVALEAVASR